MAEISKDYIKIIFKNHRKEVEVCFIKKNPSMSNSKLKSIMENEIIQGHETNIEHADCGFPMWDENALHQALSWFSKKYNIIYNSEYNKENYSKYKELIKSKFDSKNIVEVVVDTSEYYDLDEDV